VTALPDGLSDTSPTAIVRYGIQVKRNKENSDEAIAWGLIIYILAFFYSCLARNQGEFDHCCGA